MSKAVEIQVNNKTFKLGYGLEVFMTLGELWGLTTLEQVNEKFQKLLNFGEGQTNFADLKMITEIVEAMVASHPDNQEAITAKEIRCLSMAEFQTVMSQLIAGFVQNMPQPDPDETEKKLKPRAKK